MSECPFRQQGEARVASLPHRARPRSCTPRQIPFTAEAAAGYVQHHANKPERGEPMLVPSRLICVRQAHVCRCRVCCGGSSAPCCRGRRCLLARLPAGAAAAAAGCAGREPARGRCEEQRRRGRAAGSALRQPCKGLAGRNLRCFCRHAPHACSLHRHWPWCAVEITAPQSTNWGIDESTCTEGKQHVHNQKRNQSARQQEGQIQGAAGCHFQTNVCLKLRSKKLSPCPGPASAARQPLRCPAHRLHPPLLPQAHGWRRAK